MSKYGKSLKLLFLSLVDVGYGQRIIAKKLAISLDTARNWLKTYRANGVVRFIEMGTTHKAYDWQTKICAVKDHVEHGLTTTEVMTKYGISGAPLLRVWCKKYREGGVQALKPKPKGRPTGSKTKPKSYEKQLEIKIRKLQAENAYLKKLHALMAQKQATGRSPR